MEASRQHCRFSFQSFYFQLKYTPQIGVVYPNYVRLRTIDAAAIKNSNPSHRKFHFGACKSLGENGLFAKGP